MEAGALQAGLTFSGPHQQPVKLRSTRLEEFPELRPVYTLEVHDYPTFFVLPVGSSVPVLVHNDKKCVKTGKGTKGNATDGAGKSGQARSDARRHMEEDDLLLDEHDAEFHGGKGVIYRVPGSGTSSGLPYVGSADDLKKRAGTARDGRDRSKASVIGRYPIGNTTARRRSEQAAIKANGGIDVLDNKRNEMRQQ